MFFEIGLQTKFTSKVRSIFQKSTWYLPNCNMLFLNWNTFCESIHWIFLLGKYLFKVCHKNAQLTRWICLKLTMKPWKQHQLHHFVGCSTLVGQHPMKSLSSVHPSFCLSIRLSVHPSVKAGSLDFSDIVHDDNWPWYLVTDGARFLEKSFGSLNLGQLGQNWAGN